MCWCYGVVRLGGVVSLCRLKPEHTSNQSNTTHEITQQISRKLLKMDVLTFEICWAVNSEIIKQVTSSCSIFIQTQINLTYASTSHKNPHDRIWSEKPSLRTLDHSLAHVQLRRTVSSQVAYCSSVRSWRQWSFVGLKTTEMKTRVFFKMWPFCHWTSTVIPRLTKIIRSGIAFVSRNVISRRFL